jgi:hypothetical protein
MCLAGQILDLASQTLMESMMSMYAFSTAEAIAAKTEIDVSSSVFVKI